MSLKALDLFLYIRQTELDNMVNMKKLRNRASDSLFMTKMS